MRWPLSNFRSSSMSATVAYEDLFNASALNGYGLVVVDAFCDGLFDALKPLFRNLPLLSECFYEIGPPDNRIKTVVKLSQAQKFLVIIKDAGFVRAFVSLPLFALFRGLRDSEFEVGQRLYILPDHFLPLLNSDYLRSSGSLFATECWFFFSSDYLIGIGPGLKGIT